MSELLRVYFDPAEIGEDGYPLAWHKPSTAPLGRFKDAIQNPPIKDFIRTLADNRCVRCGHPYEKGAGEWSPCDERCAHFGPLRTRELHRGDGEWLNFPVIEEHAGALIYDEGPGGQRLKRWETEAQWRILTVHHLNRVKHDCRWWNLAALCQRCHLTIQGKVWLERPWKREHSEWFKPYAAGWYAWSFLGEELNREQTMARLDELLALEDRQLEFTA